MPFIHEDFLLSTKTARKLYHKFAEEEPIFEPAVIEVAPAAHAAEVFAAEPAVAVAEPVVQDPFADHHDENGESLDIPAYLRRGGL